MIQNDNSNGPNSPGLKYRCLGKKAGHTGYTKHTECYVDLSSTDWNVVEVFVAITDRYNGHYHYSSMC